MLRLILSLPFDSYKDEAVLRPRECRLLRQWVIPSRLKAEIRTDVTPCVTKTRMSGSSERERVSEYLEESPRRLARSFRARKSWDVSRRRVWPAGGGLRGRRQDHPRQSQKALKSFALPR